VKQIVVGMMLAALGLAQTQVDIRTQTKGPLKTGALLPVACEVGEVFFLTGVAAGQNLYGCSTANTWTQQAGGGSGGGSGVVTVRNAGAPVGSRSILDFTTGPGVLLAVSDTGQAISLQASADVSLMQTVELAQAGSEWLCASSSASATTYTCSTNPALTEYTVGMVLRWKPDVNGAGGATTLNVDTLGAVPVKLADGARNPVPGDIEIGQLYQVWYDGAAFRMLDQGQVSGVSGATRPTCAVEFAGRLWFRAGGTGVQDHLEVCAKDAANAYAWRVLY
jgi:hypothetical protein